MTPSLVAVFRPRIGFDRIPDASPFTRSPDQDRQGGGDMGDLRNKQTKQAWDEAHRRYMAKRYPPKPAPPLPKCLCGLTYLEMPIMRAVEADGWPRRVDYYCPACVPDCLRGVVVADEVGRPDSDG